MHHCTTAVMQLCNLIKTYQHTFIVVAEHVKQFTTLFQQVSAMIFASIHACRLQDKHHKMKGSELLEG